MRARPALGVALAAALLLTLAGATPAFRAPTLTRERMESALAGDARWRFVYGTLDPAAAPVLRQQALRIARRLFGGDSAAVIADRALRDEELRAAHLVVLGGPAQNALARRLAPVLPVRFDARGFDWFGTRYDRAGDAIQLVYPNPFEPRHFVVLVAANTPATLGRRGAGFHFGGEDWRIERDGERVRSGSFAQSASAPWRYDAALDRDREAERARFERGLRAAGAGAVRVRAPDGVESASALAAAEGVLARMERTGLGAPRGAPPVTLTLHRSIEDKGVLVRDTRPGSLDARGEAHAAPRAGAAERPLWPVAAARLVRLGAAPDGPLLEPAAVWLAGRFEGEPLAAAVARLYAARLLPTAAGALAREPWRSPLVLVPARALVVRALAECAGPRARAAVLGALAAGAPSTLDSLGRALRLDPRAVERRYAALADSLGRAGRAAARAGGPRAWQPGQGFMRGVCLAHSVSLERGYASRACARELERLHGLGAEWVSLTPFAYLPSLRSPELVPSVGGGIDEESDEALCEAGARARALGMRVMLKPHLWTRGWVGAITLGPEGWRRFFARYREFLLHHALLAEREGFDALVVGHELATASLGHPAEWRALIAEVRRVYRGTVTYGANWGDEVTGVAFWDAVDVIGVSFYEPLASRPTRSVPELRAGAARALAGLRAVATRTGRPVALLEAGYAPHADAMVHPWDEGERGAADLEAQRACYQALVEALDDADWVAGAFWWKWFSSSEGLGAGDHSFSPQRKPAEGVLARAMAAWAGRPVRPPVARGTGRVR